VSTDADILRTAAELAEHREPFVLLTVTATRGSTPRNPGARMIWRPGAETIGTVGGGNFEHLALAAAQRVFRDRARVTEHFVLGAQADQCCGGTVDVFLEYIGPSHRVVLFGAGHVSKAIADLLRPAPVEITIADERPDWNSAERFPSCRRITDLGGAIALCADAPASTIACVMTHSHDTDLDILRGLLSVPTPPAFVGLIGSRSKRACLFRRLAESGIDRARIDAVRCPIGLGDMGKEPPLIAVSIAGEILLECKRCAAL
jgi:xanthine dehydrogenase accessory factor